MTRRFAKQSAGWKAKYQPWMLAQYRPTPALSPTDAMPGTPEKITILQQRLESGAELFHPDDLTVEPITESIAWQILTIGRSHRHLMKRR